MYLHFIDQGDNEISDIRLNSVIFHQRSYKVPYTSEFGKKEYITTREISDSEKIVVSVSF